MTASNKLDALRAFEAAARQPGRVSAGNEICVMHAAVAQPAPGLEDSQGVDSSVRSGTFNAEQNGEACNGGKALVEHRQRVLATQWPSHFFEI